MSVPLVVLDWMIPTSDGSYVKEGKCSVKSMSAILRPRKEYKDYTIGEQVEAKFVPSQYKAEIIAIGLKVIIFCNFLNCFMKFRSFNLCLIKFIANSLL